MTIHSNSRGGISCQAIIIILNSSPMNQPKRPILLDGAMGTELMRKGLELNELADSWNISHPEIIENIHQSYLNAGSEILFTNTFGCHQNRLNDFGLGNQLHHYIHHGVKIARKVAQNSALIAGSLGPMSSLNTSIDQLTDREIEASYMESILSFVEAGIDILAIETQTSLREILIAVKAAKENLPPSMKLLVSMTLNSDGLLPMKNENPELIMAKHLNPHADIIGFNCHTHSKKSLEKITDLKKHIIKKTSLKLNSLIDPSSYLPPTEFIQTAGPYIDLNFDYIGGCCGTTAEHILQIKNLTP